MQLTDLIDLHRVEVVEETEDAYQVRYGDMEYEIEKDAKTEWASATTTSTVGLAVRLEQRLVPESGIFQDEEVPAAYKEVMMFHEIREKMYVEERGLETELAHQLALNDEILYVLKFFNKKEAKEYLTFAQKYREERRALHQKNQEKDDEEEYANLMPVYALLKRIEKGRATPDHYQEVYFLILTEHPNEYDRMWHVIEDDRMLQVIEETGNQPTKETLARVCKKLFDNASMNPQAGWTFERLPIIQREFGYSPPKEEIQARYDEYAHSLQKEPTAFVYLYKATGISPTLAQIRKQKANTRRGYQERMGLARNRQEVADLKKDRDYYLTELNQLADEVRERKK